MMAYWTVGLGRKSFSSVLAPAVACLCLGIFPTPATADAGTGEQQWWRGNIHTHTFWSDGDDFPENVAKWYHDNGYHFLAHTDHNILLVGERWHTLPEDHQALEKYRSNFGEEWVETRPVEKEDHVEVRLRPLEEFRGKFEREGEFLLLMGNEITNHHSVHLVGVHHDELIPTVEGTPETRTQMIQDTVDNVTAYRISSGRNTHAILAHPNWQWAITAEMMIAVEDLRFFEVYNGHPGVRNDGDGIRASTDRMWDIVLASRLAGGNDTLLYGAATDDAHNYHGGWVGPGRGWIMVRSGELTPDALLDALDRGDFYATTGITLRDIRQDGNTVHVEIDPEEGVGYVTEFVGTRRGFDPESTPTLDEDGQAIPNTTRTYSDTIGEVLHRSTEPVSSYTLTEDDLYVRVRITSTADHLDPVTGAPLGGTQRAWGQPMVPVE